MIHQSVTQSVTKPFSALPLRSQGTGKILLSGQKDVFMLVTGGDRYMIHAPGHSFKEGDEVDFEFINGSVFLTKRTTSSDGDVFTPPLRDQFTSQVESDTAVLLKTLEAELDSIDQNENIISLSTAFLRQLSEKIKGQLSSEQLQQLNSIIELIEKQDPSTVELIETKIKQLIDLLSSDRVKLNTPLASMTRLVTFPEMILNEGVFQFRDMESVLTFLGNPKMDGWETYLKNIFGSEGSAWVRIIDTGNKYPGAVLVESAALKNELVSMISSVSPSVLQKIPIDTFLSFLKVNGGIDKDFIKLLSDMSAADTSNEGMAGSSPSSRLHWLQSIVENMENAHLLALRQPSGGTDLFRALLDLKEKYNSLSGLNFNDIGIIPGSGKNTIALFENTLQKLGLTTEKRLSEGVLPADSVKTQLFRLLDNNQVHSGAPYSQSDSNKVISGKIPFDIQQNIRTFESFLRQEILHNQNSAISSGKNVANLLTGVKTVVEKFISGSSDYQSSTSMLSQVGTQTRERLSILVTALDTVIQSKGAIDNVNFKKLNEISSVLEILKQISSVTPGLKPLQDQIANCILELKSYLSMLQMEKGSGASVQKSEVDAPGGDHRLENSSENSVPSGLENSDDKRAVPQKVVEQIINKIESLQVLAKQVSTSDGSSQILELPVKIGNEWTDVTLQLIKRESDKKHNSGGQKHFTVYLDAAPSRLGGIHTILDYEKGKSLSITMEFEHKEVTSWFLRNQEQLRKTLQENQIHFVSLCFRTSAGEPNDNGNDVISKTNQNLDIRV
jgi:hypothetical protein